MKRDEKLYLKQGRRYVPAPTLFYGWPADGIWLVDTKPGVRTQMRICRVGEVPDAVKLAAIERHRDEASTAVMEVMKAGPYSAQDLVTAVFRVLAKEE